MGVLGSRASDYFISSSAPFHVAFPKDDGLVQGMELHATGVESPSPSPRLALHATWKRRGEAWRRATEDVLLELNARTLLRAHRFVLAPKPAIPRLTVHLLISVRDRDAGRLAGDGIDRVVTTDSLRRYHDREWTGLQSTTSPRTKSGSG